MRQISDCPTLNQWASLFQTGQQHSTTLLTRRSDLIRRTAALRRSHGHERLRRTGTGHSRDGREEFGTRSGGSVLRPCGAAHAVRRPVAVGALFDPRRRRGDAGPRQCIRRCLGGALLGTGLPRAGRTAFAAVRCHGNGLRRSSAAKSLWKEREKEAP